MTWSTILAAVICVINGALVVSYLRRSRPGSPTTGDEPAPPPANGVYVEVDFRDCQQFNRVPLARLRDRPHCGKCKSLLAPKRRLTICRVSDMNAELSSDLDRVWTDPDRLWHRVADHLSAPRKAVN